MIYSKEENFRYVLVRSKKGKKGSLSNFQLGQVITYFNYRIKDNGNKDVKSEDYSSIKALKIIELDDNSSINKCNGFEYFSRLNESDEGVLLFRDENKVIKVKCIEEFEEIYDSWGYVRFVIEEIIEEKDKYKRINKLVNEDLKEKGKGNFIHFGYSVYYFGEDDDVTFSNKIKEVIS